MMNTVSKNWRYKYQIFAVIMLDVMMQSGCTSTQTYNSTARAGDTISVAFGYQSYEDNYASRDNTSIRIKDSADNITVYRPGDPRIKAIFNLYPDPASYLVVGTETGQDIRSTESSSIGYFAGVMNSQHKDWMQPVAFIDLPTTMALGSAQITLQTDEHTAFSNVEIIDGVGVPYDFNVKLSPSDFTPLERLHSLERSPHHIVKISGASAGLVQAIDARFTHDPDVTGGGVGRPHVANPRGDITSINWSDTGTELRVLVTPTRDQLSQPDRNLLFYIAGGLTGMQLSSILAVDENGDPVPDITATLSPIITSWSPSGPVPTGSLVTVNGEAFCGDCVTSGLEAWVGVNGTWTQVTPSSITSSSFTFDMPQDSSIDDEVVVLVYSPGGAASKAMVVQ